MIKLHTDATILGLAVHALRSFILFEPAIQCRQVNQSLAGVGSAVTPFWKVGVLRPSILLLLEQLATNSEV